MFRLIALQDFAASGLTESEIIAEAKRQGVIAVNDSDLGAYKDHVATKMRADTAKFRPYLDALIAGENLIVDGVVFKTLSEIESHSNATIKEKAIDALIERTKARIIGNGTTTAGNKSLSDFHGTMQSTYNSSKTTGNTIDTIMSIAPEAGMVAHMGRQKAAIKGAMHSGKLGIFWGAGFSVIQQGVFADNIDYTRVGVQAGASGIGDALGSFAGFYRVDYPTLVTRYGMGGAIAGKIRGGGIAGAISAPVVELSTMIYDDYNNDTINYEGYEYSSRVGSEAVGGLIVGAATAGVSAGLTAILSTAVTGAAAGTVVPGVGNVAGFVIGLAVGIAAYAIYSTFFKDKIQQDIAVIHLKTTDQLYTLSGNWEVTDFGYFHIVHNRVPGGTDYAVKPTTTKLTIMNPFNGSQTELIKVKAVGVKAKELFGTNRQYEFVDVRILKKI